MDYSNNKYQYSPLSQCFTTSDLGSSPRSSISFSCNANGLLNPNFYFNNKKSTTSDYDADSDIGGSKDCLLNPNAFLLSPTPYSPLSDYHSETPFWSRSPNLSPLPTSTNNLHFK